MSIQTGQVVLASDFIDEASANPSPASDVGRVVKLEANGAINPGFVSGGFGNGSDGNVTLDGSTDYATFSTRSGSVYTLTRHILASNLTVNSGVTLRTDGFYVLVKNKLDGAGTIEWGVPNPGSSGGYSGGAGDSTGGSGGAQSGTGPLKNRGGANGGNGGGISSTAGNDPGSTGAATSECIGSAGSGGGGGGNGGGVAGSGGGGGGSITAPNTPFPMIRALVSLWFDKKSDGTLAQLQPQGMAGGGGGGRDSSGSFCSGPGGGGGASGGDVLIFARIWAGAFTIKSTGGAGGAGLAGQGAGTGGGGGGAGGNGGNSLVVYGRKTWTGSYNLAGGAGGAGGASGGGGSDSAGTNGNAGSSGTSYEITTSDLI